MACATENGSSAYIPLVQLEKVTPVPVPSKRPI